MKKKTLSWRLMERYEAMKVAKGAGKSIIAAARKVSGIIWTMLTRQAGFEEWRMTNKKLARKAASMQTVSLLLQ